MLRMKRMITLLVALMFALGATSVPAQNIVRDYNADDDNDSNYEYSDRTRSDRYLDVEIWTNHNDGEYYEGDKIVIHYRTNADAFVAIYSIDTRGRVNMLFPSEPGEDNFVQGGVTYHMPGKWDEYDLVISGPEGVENIQIVASRDRFPVPDWYPTSGLVCDWDDRFAYMDYLNERFFVRFEGQRFAYNRASIYVNEWEEYYYRPVYYPVYHPWTVSGNVYIDYPFGASVYVNGIYWGCAPLYLPRVYVGWHTITVYDRWGYCWESDFHVSRYHTVVLDHRVIQTSPSVQSKYREVRLAGYRDPVSNGYPKFAEKKKAVLSSKQVTMKEITISHPAGKKEVEVAVAAPKKHIRGSTEIVKTKRGWETTGIINNASVPGTPSYNKPNRKSVVVGSSDGTSSYQSKGYSSGKTTVGADPGNKPSRRSIDVRGKASQGYDSKGNTGYKQNSTNSYYQKKSGSSFRKKYDRSTTLRPNTENKRSGKGSTLVRPPAGGNKSNSKGSSPSYSPGGGSNSKGSGSTIRPSGGSKSSGRQAPTTKSGGGSSKTRSKGKSDK